MKLLHLVLPKHFYTEENDAGSAGVHNHTQVRKRELRVKNKREVSCTLVKHVNLCLWRLNKQAHRLSQCRMLSHRLHITGRSQVLPTKHAPRLRVCTQLKIMKFCAIYTGRHPNIIKVAHNRSAREYILYMHLL